MGENRLISMDSIWRRYGDIIPHSQSLCDYLNVDFVGVTFVRHADGLRKKYIVVPQLPSRRGGIIRYRIYKNLPTLLQNRRGRLYTMSYDDFMQKFVWSGNYYCSRNLLDILLDD